MSVILQWIDEVQPTIVQHGDYENPDERVEFHEPMLTRAMRERLERLANEETDEGTCEASGCVANPVPSPGARTGPSPVGYVLYEDDDEPHRSGWAWHWTTVVEVGGKAIVVCEDCTPTNVYASEEQ